MFGQLLTVVGIILLAIMALDYFFLRRFTKRRSLIWDIAPVIGFVGIVLLALAFVEATRRAVFDAWRWGTGFGLLLLIGLAVAMWVRANVRAGPRESGLRAAVRIAQTYGIVLLLGLLGVIISVRVIGALLEVFLASALGVLAIGATVGLYVREWRRKAVNSK